MGSLEIKCPFSMDGNSVTDLSPAEIACRYKQFCLHRDEQGSLTLRTNHSYYTQVQGEMVIIGVEWCDFVVYTSGGLHVERLPSDFSFWQQLRAKLELFFCKHVLTELLTGNIHRAMQSSQESKVATSSSLEEGNTTEYSTLFCHRSSANHGSEGEMAAMCVPLSLVLLLEMSCQDV